MTSVREVWEMFDSGKESFSRDEMEAVLIDLGMSDLDADKRHNDIVTLREELARERSLVDVLRRSLSMRLVPDEVG